MQQVASLLKEGLYQDAYQLAEKQLFAVDTASEELTRYYDFCISTLTSLNRLSETFDDLTQRTLERYPQHWALYAAAARHLEYAGSWGSIIEGKFVRSSGRGQPYNVEARDRIQAILWLSKAIELCDQDSASTNSQKAQLYFALGQRFFAQPQQLLSLTDLKEIPEPEEATIKRHYRGFYYESNQQGYPVDHQNQPVYFAVPTSFDAAVNDGERWRYLWNQAQRLDPKFDLDIQRNLASTFTQWYDVTSLTQSHRELLIEANQIEKKQQGVLDLDTLQDHESFLSLSTGIQRIQLPEDVQFIKRLQKLAQHSDVNAQKYALGTLTQIYLNRRQRERAAQALNDNLQIESNSEVKTILQSKLDQITLATGKLHARASQVAGVKAQVELLYRNAKQVHFKAHRINTTLLFTRIHEANSSKRRSIRNRDSHWLASTLHNLIGESNLHIDDSLAQQLLGDPVHEWSSELEFITQHRDQQRVIDTPIQQRGIYVVTASFEGSEHQASCMLELVDSIATYHRSKEGPHLIGTLLNAATGEPLTQAKVVATGYYRDQDSLKRETKTLTTDQQGHFELPQYEQRYLTWYIEANSRNGEQLLHTLRSEYSQPISEEEDSFTRIFSQSDRPIYRPEQDVHLAAWARRVSYLPQKNGNPFAKQLYNLHIIDPRGEEIVNLQNHLNEDAVGEYHLRLPQNASLGRYTVIWSIGSHSDQSTFLVEEYRKPEFEVELIPDSKDLLLGNKVKVKVKANYLFGSPVANAELQYKITRESQNTTWAPAYPWDWLYGSRPIHSSHSKIWPPRPVPITQELLTQQTVQLDAKGEFEIAWDTALAKQYFGDQDHRYQLTAIVTDSSRRSETSHYSILVPKQAFSIHIETAQGFYAPQQKAQLKIHVKDAEKRDVEGQGQLKLSRLVYRQQSNPEVISLQELALNSDTPETLHPEIILTEPGHYRFEVTFQNKQQQSITTQVYRWVIDPEQQLSTVVTDQLKLTSQQIDHAVGDQAKVLIEAPHEGAHLFIFERPQDGRYLSPRHIVIPEGNTYVHTLDLSIEDLPNCFLEVFSVSQGEIHQEVLEVRIPPESRQAQLDLKTQKQKLQPQEEDQISIQVTDAKGQPLQGIVMLTAYDRALDLLAGANSSPSLISQFWGWKRSHHLQSRNSLAQHWALYHPANHWRDLGIFNAGATLEIFDGSFNPRIMARGAMQKGAMPLALAVPITAEVSRSELAQDAIIPAAASVEAEATLRQDFADSLLWQGYLKTSAEGEAKLPFKMSDDLTSWVIRGWVLGTDNQVAEANIQIVSHKDLLIRQQAPRFFTRGDQFTVSGIVQNDLPANTNVRATIELSEGLELVVTPVEQKSAIDARGQHRFDWQVKATQSGEAQITLSAYSAEASDRILKRYNVIETGLQQWLSWSQTLNERQRSQQWQLHVPTSQRPSQNRLELKFSGSLAGAMLQALPYLMNYPYECIEQTLNRFVPAAVTLRTLDDLNVSEQELSNAFKGTLSASSPASRHLIANGTFDRSESSKWIEDGLQHIARLQNGDGGWSWIGMTDRSSIHITNLVVQGLWQAGQAGFEIPQQILDNALRFLENEAMQYWERTQLPKQDPQHISYIPAEQLLTQFTLTQFNKSHRESVELFYTKRLSLPKYSQTLLGLTCQRTGLLTEAQMIAKNLQQFEKQDGVNQTAWLDFGNQDQWWFWYNDETESLIRYLQLKMEINANDPDLHKFVKYLMLQRHQLGHWQSTRCTATAIEVLSQYIKTSQELNPQLEVEIRLNGKSLKTSTINRENLWSHDLNLLLTGKEIPEGEHQLEIVTRGHGNLYGHVALSYFNDAHDIPAEGSEISIQRKYYRIIDERTSLIQSNTQGQPVPLDKLKQRREPLKNGELLSSGSIIEVELTLDSKNEYEYLLLKDPKPAGAETVEARSGSIYQSNLSSYREFRDQAVIHYIEQLKRGKYSINYRLRVETPGTFQALSSELEAMYSPDLKANGSNYYFKFTEKP